MSAAAVVALVLTGWVASSIAVAVAVHRFHRYLHGVSVEISDLALRADILTDLLFAVPAQRVGDEPVAALTSSSTSSGDRPTGEEPVGFPTAPLPGDADGGTSEDDGEGRPPAPGPSSSDRADHQLDDLMIATAQCLLGRFLADPTPEPRRRPHITPGEVDQLNCLPAGGGLAENLALTVGERLSLDLTWSDLRTAWQSAASSPAADDDPWCDDETVPVALLGRALAHLIWPDRRPPLPAAAPSPAPVAAPATTAAEHAEHEPEPEHEPDVDPDEDEDEAAAEYWAHESRFGVPICLAEDAGWLCSLVRGHAGDHIAEDGTPDAPVARWARDGAA